MGQISSLSRTETDLNSNAKCNTQIICTKEYAPTFCKISKEDHPEVEAFGTNPCEAKNNLKNKLCLLNSDLDTGDGKCVKGFKKVETEEILSVEYDSKNSDLIFELQAECLKHKYKNFKLEIQEPCYESHPPLCIANLYAENTKQKYCSSTKKKPKTFTEKIKIERHPYTKYKLKFNDNKYVEVEVKDEKKKPSRDKDKIYSLLMEDVKEISYIEMPGLSPKPSFKSITLNKEENTISINYNGNNQHDCKKTMTMDNQTITVYEELIAGHPELSYKTQTNEFIRADAAESFFTFKTNTKDTESISIYLDSIESKYTYFLKDNATLQVVFDFFEEKLDPYLDKCNKTENP